MCDPRDGRSRVSPPGRQSAPEPSALDFGSSGAGEFAANTVAVYSPDRPHVLVHGDPALSPWIDRADLDRRGIVLLWEGFEGLPADIKATFPRAELQPPLTLPRQTLYPRTPATVNFALLSVAVSAGVV